MKLGARLREAFSFPLLAKELAEAAAQRRTYVIRVVYALLLYVIFVLMIPRWVWKDLSAPLQAIGVGRELFEQLAILQFFGILLFLPALMCGRIAQEKERDSLVLLFLTDLRPWQIVLQKYAGGLVPMLSFLLLGMPLAALAYSFGGITALQLLSVLAALVLTALQLGALALFCSAWCRTTVSAFLSSYFLGAAFYAGPMVTFLYVKSILSDFGYQFDWWHYEDYMISHVPFIMLMQLSRSGPLDAIVRVGLVSVSTTLLFLVAARVCLVRRAFVPPSHYFLKLFRRFDGVMQRANRLVGNVMVVRDRENLPVNAPILWRETNRRALGKVHYLARILVLIEIPTVLLCAMVSFGDGEGLPVLATFLGGLAVTTLSVQSANTIVSERLQQTLEVLLTTPMSAAQILREKERALRRLMVVLAIPLLTVFCAEAWLMNDNSQRHADGPLAYLVCSVFMVTICLPLISWISLNIGLRVRTRFRAIAASVGTIVVWMAVPYMLLAWAVSMWQITHYPILMMIGLLSPLTLALANEGGELHSIPWEVGTPWLAICTVLLIYALATLYFRHRCLASADRLLRR